MDAQLLLEADRILSACGRVLTPSGRPAILIPKCFSVSQNFAAGSVLPNQTVTQDITGPSYWVFRSIQITPPPDDGGIFPFVPPGAITVQIQLPNGRFLSAGLFQEIQGYGSNRYLLSKPLRCVPGSKIVCNLVCLDTTVAQSIQLVFEGAYEFYTPEGADRVQPGDEISATLPRYFSDQGQNLFAPLWQQGIGPSTPDGYQDEEFVYAAPVPIAGTGLFNVAAGPYSATQRIQIEPSSYFHCRKLLFETTPANTVTSGTVLARIRNGSGYALCDDYFDVATYIGSAPMPIDWILNPQDSVYADLQLVDYAGTGNLSFRMYLEGFRRRLA